MRHTRRTDIGFGAIAILLIVVVGHMGYAQVNAPAGSNLPNPYRAVDKWAQLPAGVQFGAVSNVKPDAKGNVWVFHRGEPPIMQFDSSGKFLKSFGTGMFVQTHGLAIDNEGNIWATDQLGKDGKGQQVFKFSPEGKVLLTLGKAGVAGDGPDTFNNPSDVVIAANGDIFVADGHGGQTNARIVKFSKDGKFIKTWGKKGSAPGEIDGPHSIAMDSTGRIFVADRGNSRLQIFDQDGKFIDQWKQFGRPTGVYISKDDTIYVVDSQSDERSNPGYKRGIRVGSAKDGVVKALIPDLSTDPAVALAEGVSGDANGNVYAAGVTTKTVLKFAKQ